MTSVTQIPPLVTLIGGSGFIGRHLVRALAQRGYRIRVACRSPNLANHLQPLGNVGQIQVVQANIRNRASIVRAVQGSDHVVNLVGILYESGRQTFATVQEEGARIAAEAARDAGASFIQFSALGADAGSPAAYSRTKAGGEAAVMETMPNAVVIRPSIVFGPEDRFFNRFAAMSRLSPMLPLIGGGHTRLQPVYVVDVAEGVARIIDGNAERGRIYEFGGPEVLSFRQCLEMMLRVIGRKRLLAPVPWGIARLQGTLLGLLPRPLLTRDQVEMLTHDNIVSQPAQDESRTLQGIGVRPHTIDSILPSYLWQFRTAGQYTRPNFN